MMLLHLLANQAAFNDELKCQKILGPSSQHEFANEVDAGLGI